MLIAVDGPAASGKGTVASALARHYALPYLDTGLLYRAVGGLTLARFGRLEDDDAQAAAAEIAATLRPDHLDDPALRTREAGVLASKVAAWPMVRAALLDLQRRFADQTGGAVLDGRDIGTVIAPHAPAKLFITADAQVRAERRWKQLTGAGQEVAFDAVLADIQARDERDSSRATAPLVQAHDAVLLDTSEMTIEAAFDAARRIVEAARAHRS